VDRLTKVAHFIPVKTIYSGAKLAELYMSRIVCLHGVPKKIVSDGGSQFTSIFWEKLHESMDTKLNYVRNNTCLFVRNNTCLFVTFPLFIILLPCMRFEHPGHTYGGFVPSFSERGMTLGQGRALQVERT
jgi:hypothetical protein